MKRTATYGFVFIMILSGCTSARRPIRCPPPKPMGPRS
jgi:hypothetical protein